MAKIKENKFNYFFAEFFGLKKLAKIVSFLHFPGGDLSEIEAKIGLKITIL